MPQQVPGRRPGAKSPRPLPRRSVVFGVGLLAGVVAIVAILIARGSGNRPGPAPAAVYQDLPAEGRTLGAANAPATIVEYSDFQCPFCKRAAEEILSPLRERYVRTGKVRFRYQPVAILGPESALAAEAALCAEDQDKFWTYHDRLFAEQAGENGGTFNAGNLKRFARDLGLDQARFNTCLDTRQHEKDVQAINEEARSRGVTGTPTFFVNDTRVVGAVPFAEIERIIEGVK